MELMITIFRSGEGMGGGHDYGLDGLQILSFMALLCLWTGGWYSYWTNTASGSYPQRIYINFTLKNQRTSLFMN